ncbi:MAG: hypothetical protein J3Q66DRAFT_134143 [Benniella sp.]|nr:MAG: hypothetical protein J3Q66DRAFT_134143 [Benniella sp.]
MGPGGAPMNNPQGQGPIIPGAGIAFPAGRPGHYHGSGGNVGPGGPAGTGVPGGPGGMGGPRGNYVTGFAASSGMPYGNSGGGTGNSNSSANSGSQLPYGHASQHSTPTHSPFASSPSSSGHPNSKTHASTPLRRYVLLPPPKKKKLHKSSDLGNDTCFLLLST